MAVPVGATGTGSGLPAATPDAGAIQQGANGQFYAENQQQTQQGVTAQNTAGNQANIYGAGSQALQAALPQTLLGILNGSQTIPGYMTAPPAAFQNLNNQINTQLNPQLAAAYGAGSPQIGAQDAQAQVNLASQLYQNGVQNYQNFLNQGLGDAFQAVGQNTGSVANGNSWQSGNQNTLGYQGPSGLIAAGQAVGGSNGIGGAAAGSILAQLLGQLGGP